MNIWLKYSCCEEGRRYPDAAADAVAAGEYAAASIANADAVAAGGAGTANGAATGAAADDAFW